MVISLYIECDADGAQLVVKGSFLDGTGGGGLGVLKADDHMTIRELRTLAALKANELVRPQMFS